MAASKMVNFRLNEAEQAAVAMVAGSESLGVFAKRVVMERAAAEGGTSGPARVTPIGSRFERVHHPRCACPLCKPPKRAA